MFRSLRNAFVSGLLVLAPVGVTFFVIDLLVQRIGGPTRRMIFFFIPPDRTNFVWLEYGLYIAAVLFVALLITLLGWFSKLLLGRVIVNTFERIVDNVPIVRSVYNTVKQIRDTFIQQEKAVFQKSVLIEYPRRGIWAVGFLTSTGRGEIQHRSGSTLLNVFLPTTPNPTSGFLLMIPSEDVHDLDMSIADAMKLIISGGAVVPPWNPENSSQQEIVPDVPQKDAPESPRN